MELRKKNTLKKYYHTKHIFFWIVQLIFIILFAIIIHLDIHTNILHLDKFGMSNLATNKTMNYMIKVLGAYGLIQVFSQDIGLHTGNYQIMITHHPISKFILLFCTGFTLTGDRSESLIATILYFYLRNILSTDLIKSSSW